MLANGKDENGDARWPDPTASEATATGQLLAYDDRNGLTSVCSAAVLESQSRSVVITAAHCVFKLGKPIENGQRVGGRMWSTYEFTPGYNGEATEEAKIVPYGRWTGSKAWVFPGTVDIATRRHWTDGGAEDMAVISIDPKDGQRIQDVVGGFAPQGPTPDSEIDATLMGYPKLWENNLAIYKGQALMYCAEKWKFGRAGRNRLSTPGCRVQHGNSGGPIIARQPCAQEPANHIVGVVSGYNGKESLAVSLTGTGYETIVREADEFSGLVPTPAG